MNFHARRPTGAKLITPQTLIQMTFDKCDGDRQKAARDVLQAAKTSEALTTHLMEAGARTVVGNLICSDRAKIYRADETADVTQPLRMARPDTSAHQFRVSRRAGLELRMMLDAPLSSGKRMGDAIKQDVEAEVQVYEPQARDMMTKVNYFRAIAARLPDGKKVGEVLDNAALTALWEAARIPA